ncbi:hypothetical protein [Dyadobacter soli]|uniref:hypothetical protein n=1 Tax=Dyadobacter soli TaxID=659014 RepID=UPI00159FDC58|nr:hypothetical protein [Dyadobacter soli]
MTDGDVFLYIQSAILREAVLNFSLSANRWFSKFRAQKYKLLSIKTIKEKLFLQKP